MKTILIALTTFCVLASSLSSKAQYAIGDSWYNNPLGFKPLELHTGMGFLVPATAVGVTLLLTQKDSSLKKRLTIFNESGLSWGYKYPGTLMPQNNTGINFMLRKYMSVGVELGVYMPSDDFNSTTGFAIRPFARFYPVNKDRWRMYFEAGGGFIYFLEPFPQPTDQDNRLGTYWNGVTKYGLGAEFNIDRSWALMFGARHVHVSNGNKKGVDRNPSHDSNGFFIGVSRKL